MKNGPCMEIRGRCWCYLVKKLMEHDFLSACVEMVHLAHPGWLALGFEFLSDALGGF